MVRRYVEGSVWRYVQGSVQGSYPTGRNLNRRGNTWRFRRALPQDLRGRAGQTEIVRGLGRMALDDALAKAQRLNALLDQLIHHARQEHTFDLPGAPKNVKGPDHD